MWTRTRTTDSQPIIERHSSGGHITAVRVGDGWRFDAWGPPGSAREWPWTAICERSKPLGSRETAEEARALVEAYANREEAQDG